MASAVRQRWGQGGGRGRWIAGALVGLLAGAATASDPERGARLFATSPAPGLLACAECHSEDPLVNNFGNIFVGRNAAPLILRAVVSNTGGMGVFRDWYGESELADIAAYLGNAPAPVDFGSQPLGSTGGVRSVTVRASSKLSIDGLQLAVEGDFVMAGTDCTAALSARAACDVQLAFRPQAGGPRSGVLLISHSGLPTPARVRLVGDGLERPPARARVLPAALAFAAPGSTRRMVLVNESVQPLRVAGVSVSSPAFRVESGTCSAGAVLTGGQSCLLLLRWHDPSQTSARLTLQHDGEGGGSELALAGSPGMARPEAGFRGAGLDFGAVELGSVSVRQAVWLDNFGTAPLRLGALRPSLPDFEIVGGSCAAGLTLAPASGCGLQLRWRPARAGLTTAELRVTIDGADEPLRLPLAGRAPDGGGRPTVAPAWLPLLATPGTRSAPRRAWVVNRGDAPLRLTAWALEGDAAADFEIDEGGSCVPGQVLAPQASCTLALRYRPAVAGGGSARLRLSHDGTGGALLLALAGTTARLPGLDRARLELDASGGWQSVTVTAPADAALRLVRLATVGDAGGDFQMGGTCAVGRELPAGSRCTVDVRFVPAAPGRRSATLVLTSDEGSVAAVSLVGGLQVLPPEAAPAASLQWRADDGAAGWPTTALGESAAATLSLHNTAPAAVTLQAIGLAGLATAEYSFDPTSECRAGGVLGAGASCRVRLNFHPAGAGPRRATLVASLEGQEPVAMAIAGTGQAPAWGIVRASPAELRLRASQTGPEAAQSTMLSNEGPAALPVAPVALQGSGFVAVTAAADEPCGGEGWALLPGESCRLGVGWTGGAAAQLGGRWSVQAGDQTLAVPLSVGEDPATVANVGAGALSLGTGDARSDLLILLAIALAIALTPALADVGAARRGRRRDRTESPDA